MPAYGWDRDRWPALWGPPDGAETVRPHLHAECDAGLDLDLDGFSSERTSPAGPAAACSSCWRGGPKARSGPAVPARMCVWQDQGCC
jgi:hypothetical protein